MLSRVYRYIRALSLDVVVGAVICCLFLGRLLQVELSISILVVLGLAVWVIYTLDHLWDAYRLEETAQSFRHRFHQRHFTLLVLLAGLAVFMGLLLLISLPQVTIIWGLVVGGLVVGYFFFLWFAGPNATYLKEIIVGLVYGLGIFIAPVSLSSTPVTLPLILIFAQFVLLAVVNLLEFSYFEIELDEQHRFGSAAIAWGPSLTRAVIFGSLLLVLLIGLMSYLIWPHYTLIIKSQPVLIAMTCTLAIIIIRPQYFRTSERFRMIGDGIFFFPALLLI